MREERKKKKGDDSRGRKREIRRKRNKEGKIKS
jgi:hypothetical protein